MGSQQIMKFIPFSSLRISPDNARKSAPNKTKDAELKASIESQGVLQNLIVRASDNDEMFDVYAGGRRLKVLGELIAEKLLPEDFEVPCLVRDEESAIAEASLSENTCREDMHPVDQYDAYTHLHNEHGLTIKDLAIHFAKSQNDIKKILKLGAVAEELREEFREGNISLDSLMAFAVVDDPARQVEAYKALSGNNDLYPQTIRSMLTDNQMKTDHRFVKLVTVKAYKAAGGTISTDLFENDKYIEHPLILNNLLTEMLEATAAELKDDWMWVEIKTDFRPSDIYNFEILDGEATDPPKDVKEKLEELRAENTRIEELVNKGGWESLSPDDNKIAHTIEDELFDLEEEVEQEYKAFSDAERARSGCIISVDYQGKIEIQKGLVRPDDKKNEEKLSPEKAGAAGSSDSAKKPESGTYSQALQDDIVRYHHAIGRRALVEPSMHEMATDLVLFQFCYPIVSKNNYWSGPLDIRHNDTFEDTSLKDLSETRAQQEFDAYRTDIDLSWIHESDIKQTFADFAQLLPAAKESIVAVCAAITLKRKCWGETGTFIDDIINEAEYDIPDYWRPTTANFFKRAKKPTLLAAGKDLFDDEWPQRNKSEKNALLAEVLGDRSLAVDADHSWLPKGFECTDVTTD